MCFCFDGQGAVTAHRPDGCRERVLPAKAVKLLPDASRDKVSETDMVRASEPQATTHIAR